jgi:hypothetical protein
MLEPAVQINEMPLAVQAILQHRERIREEKSRSNSSPTQQFRKNSRQFTNNANQQNHGQRNNSGQQNYEHANKQLMQQHQQQQNFNQQAQSADCNNQDAFRILHGNASEAQLGWGDEDNENESQDDEEDEREPS